MQRQLFPKLFLLSTLFFFTASAVLISQDVVPAREKVVRLGNPAAEDGKQGRALNVWDLQAFDNKIYLGAGSTLTNAGPINVWAYSPQDKSFIKETSVAEEAIKQFKAIDNELYILAADPKGSDSSKYYKRGEDGIWQKFASDKVKLAHVRDLIKVDNTLLAVGNSRPRKNPANATAGAAIVDSDSIIFRPVSVNNLPDFGNVSFIGYDWFFTVFEYQQKSLRHSTLFLEILATTLAVLPFIIHRKKRLELDFNLTNAEFIPEENIDIDKGKYGIDTIYQVWQPREYQDHLVYTRQIFLYILAV